jgi:hypothetical protein
MKGHVATFDEVRTRFVSGGIVIRPGVTRLRPSCPTGVQAAFREIGELYASGWRSRLSD